MLARMKKPAADLYGELRLAIADPGKWLYRLGLRSTEGLHLPDFLIIGAQKAGTTWLSANLRCHPEVFIPEPRSTHYFDTHFDRPLAYYASRFRDGAAKKKGESCPAYAVLPKTRIRAIRALLPEVRIVLLLRNPIERAWSHAVMGLVQRPGVRFDSVADADFGRHFRGGRSRERGDYLTILDNWLAVFPPAQIYVGFFDDIVARPEPLLREVFGHLGIAPDVDCSGYPYRQVINKGLGIPMPETHRRTLVDAYRDDIERLYERFGSRVAAWRCAPDGPETAIEDLRRQPSARARQGASEEGASESWSA